jgi:lanosterol synthase
MLPKFVPVYPGNMWCHSRNVYMAMSYLYGVRYKAPLDDLLVSLREELYVTPYEEINWPAQRNTVAQVDLYCPTTRLMDVLNGIKSAKH